MRSVFRIVITSLAMLGAALLAGPLGAVAQTGPAIAISGFAFAPPSGSGAPGDTVTWTNQDTVTHTVTADNGTFDSGPLDPGQSFSFSLPPAGTFTYHCSIHVFMTGAVTVTAAAGAPASAAAAAVPTVPVVYWSPPVVATTRGSGLSTT